MPTLHIDALGDYGVIQDKDAVNLPPEAWSRSDNIRFTSEGPESVSGHQAALNTPLFAPYWLQAWKTSTGFYWLYGGAGNLGRIVGGVHSNVTRFTTVLGDDDYTTTSASRWSAAFLGDFPIITSNAGDAPQQWNVANSRFEDLANWPASTSAEQVITVDRFAVMLKVTRSGIVNTREVFWSEPAEPGTYPTSWDISDPESLSGNVTLAETEGGIVCAALYNNATLIYKSDSVISMRYVGGQNIFRFDSVWTEFGCLAPSAVGTMEDGHFVVTEGDVIFHNTNTWRSVIDQKNRTTLFSSININYADLTQVQVCEEYNEVWICYADITSTGLLNKALIWNYSTGSWTFRDLQDFSYITTGVVDTSAANIIDNLTGTIDSYTQNIDAPSQNPVFPVLVAADPASGSEAFYELNATHQFNATNIPCYLERQTLAVIGQDHRREWIVDLNSTKFVNRLRPKLKATGSVDFYIGGQETPDGPVTWLGPFAFDPNSDKFIDFRLNTRFISIRLQSESDLSWKLSGYALDIEIVGESRR